MPLTFGLAFLVVVAFGIVDLAAGLATFYGEDLEGFFVFSLVF